MLGHHAGPFWVSVFFGLATLSQSKAWTGSWLLSGEGVSLLLCAPTPRNPGTLPNLLCRLWPGTTLTMAGRSRAILQQVWVKALAHLRLRPQILLLYFGEAHI